MPTIKIVANAAKSAKADFAALACIIHEDLEKSPKTFPEEQYGDLPKKQSVF